MIKVAGQWARGTWVAAIVSLCVAGAVARGATEEQSDSGVVTTTPAQDQPDGLIPKRLVWPGVVVIVVIAVIVTAALTGPIIRANTDDEEESSSTKSSE
jgi:hypothetical protein